MLKFILLSSLGASACVKLGLYDEAITWCDKGLAVSFYNNLCGLAGNLSKLLTQIPLEG